MARYKATILDWKRLYGAESEGVRGLGDPAIRFELRRRFHGGSPEDLVASPPASAGPPSVRDPGGRMGAILDALGVRAQTLAELAQSIGDAAIVAEIGRCIDELVARGWVSEFQGNVLGLAVYERTEVGALASRSLTTVKRR